MKTFKMLFSLVTVAAALSLTACNTTEGIGEDVEAAGDAVSDTARDVRD